MRYLLDTNVVSEWVKPQPNRNVIAWLAEGNENDIFISVCTLAELRFGIAWMPRGKRRDRLDLWLRNDLPYRFEGRIIPVDITIADTWGMIQARGKKIGRTIGAMDGLITATAAAYEMTVVTRDTADLKALGISSFNPWLAG